MRNTRRITFFISTVKLCPHDIANKSVVSQKTLATLFASKKIEREFFNKEEISKIMLGKKR